MASVTAVNSCANGKATGGGAAALQAWCGRAIKLLRRKLADTSQVLLEYQQVVSLDETIVHSCDAAQERTIMPKNRYCNVLPFDYNRVRLIGGGDGRGEPAGGGGGIPAPYINASLVQCQWMPGSSSPDAPGGASDTYIATQGPLATTTADFWRMVFSYRCPAVVMLTNISDMGVAKCAQYFPQTVDDIKAVDGYSVKLLKESSLDRDSCCRLLQLTATATGETHQLQHFHLHSWPDHGVPSSTGAIRRLSHALDPLRTSGSPFVVHCSAGIGRTGSFCAIDVTLQRLARWQQREPTPEEMERALDMMPLVHELRQQRIGMVQMVSQYAFCYQAVHDELLDMADN